MLKLTLPLRGRLAQVELDGIDISRFLHAIVLSTDVAGLTTATLHYRGAAVVEMTGGEVTLVQAPLYVKCDICAATIGGAPQEPQTFLLTEDPVTGEIWPPSPPPPPADENPGRPSDCASVSPAIGSGVTQDGSTPERMR